MKSRPVHSPDRFGAFDGDLSDSCGLRIGILVVAYNAVGTLVPVLKRIPLPIWDNIGEVAVFDDASHDATYELAIGYKTLWEQYKLSVVRHQDNLGYGGNQKAGYKYFIEKGFDVVVLLHADGQYAPEMLHHLYHPIVAGEAEAVFGSRMLPDYGGPLRGGMPLYKYVGNRILSSYENAALGMNLTEFHSGYRAYSLRALEKISMDRMTDEFHFDTEIIIKLHHQGFRIKEVPIPTFYGNEICYVNGLKYARDITRAVGRYRSTIRSARCYPEFEEYYVNYPLKASRGSSHTIARSLVGSQQAVLDVGCGEGSFARTVASDNDVAGVDIIPAPRYRDTFSRYECADLNDGLALTKAFGDRTFDKVLMLDVLQQLSNPEAVLRDAGSLLKPNGQIILSLPNVANFTVRTALAFGRFEYANRGILDRRHLHFYTRATIRKMLERCNYEVVKERPTVVPLDLLLDASPDNPLVRLATAILGFFTKLAPGLLAYQWVVSARRKV
jgi:2-polyprenyl-3-methyl-5-hydroxy-6-metoxy-1,4-benzoquinol methylase